MLTFKDLDQDFKNCCCEYIPNFNSLKKSEKIYQFYKLDNEDIIKSLIQEYGENNIYINKDQRKINTINKFLDINSIDSYNFVFLNKNDRIYYLNIIHKEFYLINYMINLGNNILKEKYGLKRSINVQPKGHNKYIYIINFENIEQKTLNIYDALQKIIWEKSRNLIKNLEESFYSIKDFENEFTIIVDNDTHIEDVLNNFEIEKKPPLLESFIRNTIDILDKRL